MDANLELARKTAEKFNIEMVYDDHKEILADPSINVIYTCSPNSLHFPMNQAQVLIRLDHKRSNELWIGHRDALNETLFESPVLQSPEKLSTPRFPPGYPLGYYDAMINLTRDSSNVMKAGGKEPIQLLPRLTFGAGYEEMRILNAVVESNRRRAWVKAS